jgi:hypothetical protein
MKSKYRLPIYIIAILLLTVVITDLIYWFCITSQYNNHYEMVEAYLKIFPEPLQNATIITAICIFLLGISTFIFIQAVKVNYLKVLSIVLAGLSSLLLSWQLFSLM